ncbi:hypothetical protein R6Q57_011270 [Mikania cordata]
MIDVECRRKEKIGLGFTEVKPPFNHNYSIMPNINTSADDLLLKSDRRFDFTTGSNKPVPITADLVVTDLNVSNSSKVHRRKRRKEVLLGGHIVQLQTTNHILFL